MVKNNVLSNPGVMIYLFLAACRKVIEATASGDIIFALPERKWVTGGLKGSSYASWGVSVSGGKTIETVIPLGFNSARKASEKPRTANFEAP
jgi:hypothetical protein